MTSPNFNTFSNYPGTRYQVELSTVKTKLLAFSPANCAAANYFKLITPVHIGNPTIPFVQSAEHVGVLKQLTLFGMITCLPNNIINTIAKENLNGHKHSWFSQISPSSSSYAPPESN
jgi:hypothetical protein